MFGDPLVVYHVSKSDFKEFKPTVGGIYFTEDEGMAETIFGSDYSGGSIPVYLTFKNPFDIRKPTY